MTTYIDEENHIVISGDDARGGVTGHNVRFVLEFGLAGIVAAFAAIAIYSGYDRVQEIMSAAFSQDPNDFLLAVAPYAVVVVFGAIGIGLLLRAWTLVSGRSRNASQRFMRARVATQIVAILAVIAMTLIAIS